MDSVSGKTFPTVNPANGKKIADIAEGDKVCLYNEFKFKRKILNLDRDLNLGPTNF